MLKIEFFGDEVEKITEIDALTGSTMRKRNEAIIYPATEYTVVGDRVEATHREIEDELASRLQELRSQGKLVEAQRLEQRTRFDLEMLRETGYCTGVENYSRYFTGRQHGRHAVLSIGLFSKRLSHLHRREPPGNPANKRDVRGRSIQKGESSKLWFQVAFCL